MYHKIREAQQGDREEGFTLIELLVVVIIIGILAAIAIPVFLNQRKKAWDSAAKSDLRNAATSQESYYTEAAEYTTDPGALEDEGFKQGQNIAFNVAVANTSEYCMEAFYDGNADGTADSGLYWYLDSNTGSPTSHETDATPCT